LRSIMWLWNKSGGEVWAQGYYKRSSWWWEESAASIRWRYTKHWSATARVIHVNTYSVMLLLCSYGNTGVTSGNYVHIVSLEVSVHRHPQLVGGSCTIIMYNYRGRNLCSLNSSTLSLHLNFQSTDTNHHANMYALDGMHWMENNIINTALFSIITSEKKTTKNLLLIDNI